MTDCCKGNKSNKIKNPCMVCKRPVTAKTGLQCQGTCKSWIHFTCCSYTPGRIKDIKAKVIKVRCPCPDCSNTGPKEVIMKDNSFTCINKTCPINLPPECIDGDGTLNKMNQQPSPCKFSCREWPGIACSPGACIENTQDDCCPEKMRTKPISVQQPVCPPTPPPAPCIPPPTACPPPQPCPPPPPQPKPPAKSNPPRSCTKTCSPAPATPPPASPPQASPNSSSPSRRMSPSPTPVMPSISLVENMCETVGLLSDQLNQLMCKMTDILNPNPQPGPPNPCRCPKNPRR